MAHLVQQAKDRQTRVDAGTGEKKTSQPQTRAEVYRPKYDPLNPTDLTQNIIVQTSIAMAGGKGTVFVSKAAFKSSTPRLVFFCLVYAMGSIFFG